MQRLIVANLDCEQEYAHPEAPRALPAPVRQRISAAGTLLAVFGSAGDTVWTPEPVDAARIAMPGAAELRFVSGPLQAHKDRAGALLCWGETQATWSLRSPSEPVDENAAGHSPGHAAGHSPVLAAELENWPEALWRLRADPAIARRCNDRRYCLRIAEALGMALPGAAVLSSVDALIAHLDRGHHAHGTDSTWVLEAPFSASGRLRLRRRGPASQALDQATRTRARRLFATFGELIFQPWMDRMFDIGCLGVVAGPERWRILAPHGLDIDAAGVFRGIAVGPPETWVEPDMAGAAADAAVRVADTAAEVARRLAHDGYRGPFGIDGFVYREPRDRGGQLRVHAMCEINARLSFGFVAQALAREHGGERVRLVVGTAPGTGPAPAASPRVITLLGPAPGDATAAWIERDEPHAQAPDRT